MSDDSNAYSQYENDVLQAVATLRGQSYSDVAELMTIKGAFVVTGFINGASVADTAHAVNDTANCPQETPEQFKQRMQSERRS